MSDAPVSFEMLNAYVDGELDAADAAEVARAVAADPMLARQVAALSKLRSAVADSGEASHFEPPVEPFFGGWLMAIAIVVSLVLFIAGAALVSRLDRVVGSEWLARAMEIHQGWSVAEARKAGHDSESLRAGYADSVPGAYIPDLSAARLYVAHAAVVPFTAKRQALLVGYRGTRGCKISLITFPPPDSLSEVFNFFRRDRQEGYAWRAGTLGYAILSDGMDSKRFRLIAESVRDTSRQRLPIDAKTRVALSRSRAASTPCTA